MEFYIELARAGFISTTYDTEDGLILLPELQYNYAILDFKNLHISKKVKKLMDENSYEFSINSRFNEVLEKFSSQHKYNWLKEDYVELLKNLHVSSDEKRGFKIISIELVCKTSNELIAGEVGYIIEKTYTSLSGFSSREKKYANYGTLQLVLLSKYLENNGFEFWNLGHPHMEYKQRLGCVKHSRIEFLKRWDKAVQ
ncbi:Leucyl/phenylalanyl-tRNA protein transferase [Epsilonproteobacteria bacterium SCGC AD-311-C15]|jgi:Leu/Phe-tRNA-protein transferase|nr:Leucyl/phenylalanyl-tRNA protein transferase [Epsilonproteobacteria bacterium SCGC AD-311-C15]